MEQSITGVLIDTTKNSAAVASIENSCESFCKTLRCSHTKVESIWLGGLDFAVVCDKNGMNNPLFPPSGTDRDYNAVLFGSLFICRSNLDGTLISIDAEDCEEVLQHISVVQDISDSAPHPMLFDVDMDDTF